MALNTGCVSLSELLMTLRISSVAVRYSCASLSSRVRALTCSCRSARVELAGRAAVGPLLRLGFAVLSCCVFAGIRLTEPSHGHQTGLSLRLGRFAKKQTVSSGLNVKKAGSSGLKMKVCSGFGGEAVAKLSMATTIAKNEYDHSHITFISDQHRSLSGMVAAFSCYCCANAVLHVQYWLWIVTFATNVALAKCPKWSIPIAARTVGNHSARARTRDRNWGRT